LRPFFFPVPSHRAPHLSLGVAVLTLAFAGDNRGRRVVRRGRRGALGTAPDATSDERCASVSAERHPRVSGFFCQSVPPLARRQSRVSACDVPQGERRSTPTHPYCRPGQSLHRNVAAFPETGVPTLPAIPLAHPPAQEMAQNQTWVPRRRGRVRSTLPGDPCVSCRDLFARTCGCVRDLDLQKESGLKVVERARKL